MLDYNNLVMKHFWTHKDNAPDGIGYGQFTSGHFVWLLLTVLFTIGIVFFYGHLSIPNKILLRRALGATLIIIDIIKMFIIGFSDVKLSEYLPLELCSFAAYFIVIDSIWFDNSFIKIMLLTLFLPAAIMAVLFPTTSTLPSFNFYTIHQFLYHGLIIAYVMALYVYGEIHLLYPDVWKAILSVLLLAAVIYLIDTKFDRNFMFLRDTYGNPLLEVIWKYTKGGFAYTVGLVCFCIFMIHVFYFFFKLISLLFLH